MTPHLLIASKANPPLWLRRLHIPLRGLRADAGQVSRLPLLRLAGAVLVALLALATASGLSGTP